MEQVPLTDDQSVKIIYEQGPLPLKEVLALPPGTERDYLLTMSATLRRLGPEEFIRQAAEKNGRMESFVRNSILRDPWTL